MVLEKREVIARCGYIARPGRDSYQGMHGAAQKACEPGETVAQNSITETNRFPFPTWTMRRSLSLFILFFFFDCFPSFFFYYFFWPTAPQNRDGANEIWLRDVCAHEVADGLATEMKLGLKEKMEQKVENTSNQQQLNA
jgi:hypothetical protein